MNKSNRNFHLLQNPLGQINMRDARVEEVEHVSDSDSEEREDLSQSQAHLTIAIYPAHQGPTYLILNGKQERDNWLYHLTVVSGGGPSSGTQYEQLVQKLMETDGDPSEHSFYITHNSFAIILLLKIYRNFIEHCPNSLRNVASPDTITHKGTNYITIVVIALGDAAK